MDQQPNSFAAKLNRLFAEKTKPDGSPFSQTDVINGTKEVVNRVYLWKLLTGRAPYPNIQVVQALADFFQVQPSYFFPEKEVTPLPEADPEHQFNALLRYFGLDREEQRAVTMMVEALKSAKSHKTEK